MFSLSKSQFGGAISGMTGSNAGQGFGAGSLSNNPSFKTLPYQIPKGGMSPGGIKNNPSIKTLPYQIPKGGVKPGNILKGPNVLPLGGNR